MRRIKALMLALPLALALVGTSLAVVNPPSPIDLVVEQVNVTMPDGAAVPMWKLRLASDPPGTPLPVITAVAGDALTINVTNNLTGEPVSLVINGQAPTSMVPTWTDGSTGARTDVAQRVRSFTHEAAPGGGQATYAWDSLAAGTFLITSGTHPGVQVPMGLYAALKVDAAAGQAYGPTTAYVGEAVLLFSEVDPALNTAVATGTYGTAAYTTALSERYEPKYFLINGAPFTAASPPLAVAGAGQPTLLRFLNAGLRQRMPVISGEYMTVIADDGHLLPNFPQTYSLELAAGKRFDAVIQPAAAGLITIHDRAGGMAGGGMVAYLQASDGPLIDNTSFVEQLYRNFLGRAGSAGEVQGWVAQLDAATLTRAEVVDGIMGLGEYLGRVPPLVRLYIAAFNRIPDYGGLMFWVNNLAQGTPLTAIAELFATSPEFLATYGALDNAGYVTQLFQNVLNRAPDADGLAFWVGQLDSGTLTRGEMLASFSESAEFVTLSANRVYVTGAYAGLLLRTPSAGEFTTWTAFLDGGGTGPDFIDTILASVEFAQASSVPLIDNGTFVAQLYLDFLGRAGSAVELQTWVGPLDSGTATRAEAVDGVIGLAEYAGRVPPAMRLYTAAFNRLPDYGGLTFWVDQLAQGMPLTAIAELFATSPEFLATYGALDNTGYITQLYQNVLNRAPDADGLAFWVGQLDSGAQTRGEMLASFSESAEFQTLRTTPNYVVGIYAGLLLRTPGQVEFDTWVAFLDGGGSNLAFIDELLASAEFMARLR